MSRRRSSASGESSLSCMNEVLLHHAKRDSRMTNIDERSFASIASRDTSGSLLCRHLQSSIGCRDVCMRASVATAHRRSRPLPSSAMIATGHPLATDAGGRGFSRRRQRGRCGGDGGAHARRRRRRELGHRRRLPDSDSHGGRQIHGDRRPRDGAGGRAQGHVRARRQAGAECQPDRAAGVAACPVRWRRTNSRSKRCGTIKLARALAPGIEGGGQTVSIVDPGLRECHSRRGEKPATSSKARGPCSFSRMASRSKRRTARASATWPTPIARSPSTASIGSIAARSPKWSATGWRPTAASSRPPTSPRTRPSFASRSTRPIAATRSSAFRRPAPAAFTSRRSSTSSKTFDLQRDRQARSDRGHAHHRRGVQAGLRRPGVLAGRRRFRRRAARPDRQSRTPRSWRRRSIRSGRSTSPTHGSPPNWRQDVFGRHTTHIAAADAAGNWVGITATVNTTFGSKVIVPGTGVVLNNEMDDFSIYPGMPNAFGLVGAENNSVAPGKRPLSSMSPTIVLDSDGKPVLTVGAAGGPKIITQVVLAIVRMHRLRAAAAGSRGGPRFHHQWRPNVVTYEKGPGREHRRRLAGARAQRGRDRQRRPHAGDRRRPRRQADRRRPIRAATARRRGSNAHCRIHDEVC